MSKKKGDRRERQAREILEAAGYTVETPNATPYPQGYGVDFFGLFDLMAFKEGEPPLFIQVKSNGARGIRSFSEKCKDMDVPFEFVNVEFWVCYDGDGWRRINIDSEGYENVYDERDESGINMGEGLEEDLTVNPPEKHF